MPNNAAVPLQILIALIKHHATKIIGEDTYEILKSESLASLNPKTASQIHTWIDRPENHSTLVKAIDAAEKCFKNSDADRSIRDAILQLSLRNESDLLNAIQSKEFGMDEIELHSIIFRALSRDYPHTSEQTIRYATNAYLHCLRTSLLDVDKIGDVIFKNSVLRIDKQVEKIDFILSKLTNTIANDITIGLLLESCRKQIDSVLYDARFKFNPALYIHRHIENKTNEFLELQAESGAPNCFVLVAPAGSGKTNLFCQIAFNNVTERPTVLLLGNNIFIDDKTGLLGAIQAELESTIEKLKFSSESDVLHILDKLGRELDKDVLILIDAINEHDQPSKMKKALEQLLSKIRGKRIKLLVSCRDYYWGVFQANFWESAIISSTSEVSSEINNFHLFTDDEYRLALPLYLQYYHINGFPSGDAANQCKHPLLLRFFCEAYSWQNIGRVEDLRLKELFDHYWQRKLDSIASRMVFQGDERLVDGLASEVGDYLLDIAGFMLKGNIRAVPLEKFIDATHLTEKYNDPRSIYGRIRDEYIILEEIERGVITRRLTLVAFVYEEFMEYTMARSLLREWERKNLDASSVFIEVENFISSYNDFTNIIGVMVYVALMLKEEYSLDLWSLLFRIGEKWRNIIYATIQKLPSAHLDAGVFSILEEILRVSSLDETAKVLELFEIERIGKNAPKSTYQQIIKLVTDAEDEINIRAIAAMGNSRHTEIVEPALIATLHSRFRSLRMAGIHSLGKLWSIAELIDLTSENKWARINALRNLATINDPRIVKPVMEGLRENDSDIRFHTVKVLCNFNDAVAIDGLILSLNDFSFETKEAAKDALRNMPSYSLGEKLIPYLSHESPEIRKTCAELVGRCKYRKAVPVLVELMKDSNAAVRLEAIRALGNLQDLQTLPRLLDLFHENNPETNEEASSALKNFGPVIIDSLIEYFGIENNAIRQGIILTCVKLAWTHREKVVVSLRPLILHSKWQVRQIAILILGEIQCVEVTDQLIGRLREDESANVRAASAIALGKIGYVHTIDYLVSALSDPNNTVQSAALKALRTIGTRKALKIVDDYRRKK
jgi:HEAT repeat protein